MDDKTGIRLLGVLSSSFSCQVNRSECYRRYTGNWHRNGIWLCLLFGSSLLLSVCFYGRAYCEDGTCIMVQI